MPDLTFHRAGPADAGAIISLAWEIWPEWYDQIIGPEQLSYMLYRIYQEDEIIRRMESGMQFVLVRIGKKNAGFFGIRNGGGKLCRLENLYLKNEFRGLGAGKSMLDHLMQMAEAVGNRVIQCNVNRFNSSLNFYLKHSFQIIEQKDIPFGPFFLNDFILEYSLAKAV